MALADPTGAVGVFGAAADGARDRPAAGGLALEGGWRFGRLATEGIVRAGVDGQARPHGWVGPRLALRVGPSEAPRVSVHGGSAVGHVGGAWDGMVLGGVGLGLGQSHGWRPALVGTYAAGPDVGTRLDLAVVLRFSPRPEPVPEPVPTVVEAPPAPVADPQLPVDAAMVWVSRPTCEWLPASEALPALGGRLQPSPEVPVLTSPFAAALATGEGFPPDPVDGDLLVAVLPGDLAWIDDVPVDVSEDHMVVRRLPEGRATVRVVGAGRDTSATVGVPAGSTVWLQLDDEPLLSHRVGFRQGSSDLDGEAQQLVRRLGAALGRWSVELRGGYSPEGNRDANVRLASARAAIVRDELLAAGVPEDRVVVFPPRDPDPLLSAPEQRTTLLQLVPVEAP